MSARPEGGSGGEVFAGTSGGGGGLSTSDVNALIAAALASSLATGAGVPLSRAAVSITGDGTDQERALSHGLTLVNGGYYRINLVTTVRVSGVLVCSTTLRDHVARYSSSGGGSWADDTEGTMTPQVGDDVATYFTRAGDAYTANELPGLTYAAGVLSVGVPLRTGETATVGARGTIAYLGTTL